MKQLVTTGIILARTDFGEADRILTVLTPDHGKLSLLAKGVRRVKSKLAGGIELFSVSQITFIQGRGKLDTLVSTRLLKHYGTIVKDLDRTMVAYELLKQLNRLTEEQPEAAYFELTEQLFSSLADLSISLILIQTWFSAQLLRIGGHQPNLQADTTQHRLDAEQTYDFDFTHMACTPRDDGRLRAEHIKLLRLLFGTTTPAVLTHIQGVGELVTVCGPLVQTMAGAHLRT